MVGSIREEYNNAFSEKKYETYLKELNSRYPEAIAFRVAETPIFISKDFTKKIISTCESIIDVILQNDFTFLTNAAIPKELFVPNEKNYVDFIALDFGICENDNGELEPQLIEMQGFASLFAYQVWQDEVIRNCFHIPTNYSTYLNGYNKDTYCKLLQSIIANGIPLENCILLELFPDSQKTKIDFLFTKEYIGIETVCLTQLIREGQKILYVKDGKKIEVKRIYNRIIFDELAKQSLQIQEKGKLFTDEIDVEWIPHPNWFYRISKYTLPFIKHQYVPETTFLDKLISMPADLENYVLKPLFSFAGQGVVIDVTEYDIEAVKDKHNWILQKKVKYAEVIPTPEGAAKAEVRIFFFWPKDAERPIATNNLVRLSKGKMIGVRYNNDKKWVGGTVAYFEQ